MKYFADSLSLFEFHDAYFRMIEFNDSKLQVEASAVNVHKHTEQNSADFDMEISEADITFTDFNLLSYKLIGGKIYDEKGKLIDKDETVIYSGSDAQREFMDQLRRGFNVMGITEHSDNVFCLTANSTVFEIEFTCSSIKIEWNEYAGKAWYEKI